MNHYKLREGENIRKPVVKRDRIEIHVPVLLICLALAFLVWLYVVSISKIKTEPPPVDTAPVTEQETAEVSGTAYVETVSYVHGTCHAVDVNGASARL
ncbi:MAG: hypothetical protein IJX72_06775 [Clostridia bacterium]|nr:hypothetical protein [Clostridia bacterium]